MEGRQSRPKAKNIESFLDKTRANESYQYFQEAMTYSEDNWSESLILDDWKSYGIYDLQDPTDLYDDDSPSWLKGLMKSRAEVHFTLRKTWHDMDYGPSSRPGNQLFNDSLAYFTLNPIEGMEIRGNERYPRVLEHCSNCGVEFRWPTDRTECKVCDSAENAFIENVDKRLPEAFVPPLKEIRLLQNLKV